MHLRPVPAWALGAHMQVHLKPQLSKGAHASPNIRCMEECIPVYFCIHVGAGGHFLALHAGGAGAVLLG